MSARASRPRSRRGRHAPPGELDPVAESSEEAEAASGSSELGPVPSQESCKPGLLGPEAEGSGQGPRSRTDKEADGDSSRGLAPALDGPHEPAEEAHHAPEAEEAVLSAPGAPDVFQTLQHALSSLEAAAAAWRCQPLSCPGPVEMEGRIQGEPRPCLELEGAGGCQREVAHLAERNAWLRLALGSREDELIHMQASLEALQGEKETLQREVQELQDSLLRLEPLPPPSQSQVGGLGSSSSSSGTVREPWTTQDPFSLSHPLLRRLQSDSSAQILGPLPNRPLAPEMHIVEAQMEQLQGSIEKLKCFNRLLSAVLQGYKGRCEGLSMQLGQWEAEATALRLALQYSPEGSSVDRPTLQEVALQLRGYVQRLQERRALVKILPEPGPTLAPMPTLPHAEALVQAILETQPGPTLPRLEKRRIQQDLEATRETLEDLMLRLQLVRREKRGLELQEAALRAQGPVHTLLLEQLQWERAQLQTRGAASSGGGSSGGSSGDEEAWCQGPAVPGGSRGIDGGQVGQVQDPEDLAQELSASLARALGLWEQLQFLREELEQVAKKGRARRAQSAKLNNDLCKAHRALVLAFRGAQRKQEEQRRKLEQQVTLLEARHAEELAVLEATTRVLGRPRPSRSPPGPGETFL
ncbi:Usher syndrome type-1C protein-binding protein 1 isoform X3 [Myotis myotis]|uniref:Usher syndrome type-1C protein-binding protein 1 isoform X3 n=1 Tax=Myotis myotis TaxID=51298 RepID=UPI00174D34DF|nr:Usher syndrome type-1C protein-binding protein 1 isoform X3 [Myotis myotis]